MKTLGSFINKKTLVRRTNIDEKSVLYICSIIIKEEYGKQGAKNLTPVSFRDKKIFLNALGSNWVSEILLDRKRIVAMINKELGSEEIVDLALN